MRGRKSLKERMPAKYEKFGHKYDGRRKPDTTDRIRWRGYYHLRKQLKAVVPFKRTLQSDLEAYRRLTG